MCSTYLDPNLPLWDAVQDLCSTYLDRNLPLWDAVQDLYSTYLDPNLPLWDAVQDLYSSIQIQSGKHVLDYADYTAPTRQHELDHTNHTDDQYICPERSRSYVWRSNIRCAKASKKKWLRYRISNDGGESKQALFTLTHMPTMQSVVTGQAPITLERKITSGGKQIKTEDNTHNNWNKSYTPDKKDTVAVAKTSDSW